VKWARNELIRSGNLNVSVDEDVSFAGDTFPESSLLDGARRVHVRGTGCLDSDEDCFYADLHVTGLLLCMDAISGVPLEVPFAADISETYAFHEVDDPALDVRVVTDDVIDLKPAIRDAILMEAPLAVTDVKPEDFPSGEGWRVVSEEDYEQEKAKEPDPRLAKLRELAQENEEKK
jgi:uncharacterized protein